jgi:hypothetical protein
MNTAVFTRPAPRSFTQMRLVGAQRNAPAPRAVLKLDAVGRAAAARTIARQRPDDRERAFECESHIAHLSDRGGSK